MKFGFLGAIAAGFALCGSAVAQDEGKPWSIEVRGSFFGSAEDRTYASFGLTYGFMENWTAGFRGSFAKKGAAKTVAAIQSGGSDIELFVRHSLKDSPGLSYQVGVAFPNTPAQTQTFFTYGADYWFASEEGQPSFGIGGRGVQRGEISLVGLSAGAKIPVGQGMELFGDVTGVIRGENTRSVDTGNAFRSMLYGFGFNYAPASSPASFYALYGNSLGLTTGMSLSPSLGNRGAFSFGIVLRGRS